MKQLATGGGHRFLVHDVVAQAVLTYANLLVERDMPATVLIPLVHARVRAEVHLVLSPATRVRVLPSQRRGGELDEAGLEALGVIRLASDRFRLTPTSVEVSEDDDVPDARSLFVDLDRYRVREASGAVDGMYVEVEKALLEEHLAFPDFDRYARS